MTTTPVVGRLYKVVEIGYESQWCNTPKSRLPVVRIEESEEKEHIGGGYYFICCTIIDGYLYDPRSNPNEKTVGDTVYIYGAKLEPYNEEEQMPKYETQDMDFTGCHPVIAEHLKQGKMIECWVWSTLARPTVPDIEMISGYKPKYDFPYLNDDDSAYRFAEPVIIKEQVLMPPEKSIPLLLNNGWKITLKGCISHKTMKLSLYNLQALAGTLKSDLSHCYPDFIFEDKD